MFTKSVTARGFAGLSAVVVIAGALPLAASAGTPSRSAAEPVVERMVAEALLAKKSSIRVRNWVAGRVTTKANVTYRRSVTVMPGKSAGKVLVQRSASRSGRWATIAKTKPASSGPTTVSFPTGSGVSWVRLVVTAKKKSSIRPYVSTPVRVSARLPGRNGGPTQNPVTGGQVPGGTPTPEPTRSEVVPDDLSSPPPTVEQPQPSASGSASGPAAPTPTQSTVAPSPTQTTAAPSPTKTTAAPSPTQTTPPSEMEYPTSGLGYDFDHKFITNARWRLCGQALTWHYDPGALSMVGGDAASERSLIGAVMRSIARHTGWTITEVATASQAKITITGVPEFGGPIAGTGGAMWDRLNIISGAVQIDVEDMADYGHPEKMAVYAHEIGHTLGLGHADLNNQTMFGSAINARGWGKGDVAGLTKMPSFATCPID